MANLLFASDEDNCSQLLTRVAAYLSPEHIVNQTQDPRELMLWVRRDTPDVVVLDLMVGGKDAFDIAGEIRSTRSRHSPHVIILIKPSAEVGGILRLPSGVLAVADEVLIQPVGAATLLHSTLYEQLIVSIGLSLIRQRVPSA